jgi:hypothetical protein
VDNRPCFCDTEAPVVPTECVNTAQFTCVFGATATTCCHCDPLRPTDESVCPGDWFCHSYDPPVDCSCQVVIL